jgi:hypothetical protein
MDEEGCPLDSAEKRLARFAPIDRWVLAGLGIRLLIAWSVSVPLVAGFFRLRDGFNMINYLFVVPVYMVFSASFLQHLSRGIDDIVEHYELRSSDPERLKKPLLTWLRNGTLVFMAGAASMFAQLQYAFNELGLFTRRAAFLKWNAMYEDSPLAGFGEVFTIYYLVVQYVILAYCIMALLAVLSEARSVYILLFRRRGAYMFRAPERYLGLDRFRLAVSRGYLLVLVVGVNAATYSYNVRPAMPVNLAGFWLLFVVVLVYVIGLHVGAQGTLRSRRSTLKDRARQQHDEQAQVATDNIQESLFSVGQVIMAVISIVLGIVALIISALPPELHEEVSEWLFRWSSYL